MHHHVTLTLSPSYTGKAPDTPLAQPPTSEKDGQNKTEQLGELLLGPLPRPPTTTTQLTVHTGMLTGAFQKPKKPSFPEGAKAKKGREG